MPPQGHASTSIVLRCDASVALGSGHAVRCLALAQELAGRGATVTFAVNRDAPTVVPGLTRFPLHFVAPDEGSGADAGRDLAQGFTIAIIDHYGRDARYETGAASTGARVVAIDDLGDRRHTAHVLVDGTPGRLPADYARSAPHSDLMLGGDYALLRASFRDHHLAYAPKARDGRRLRVLVSMGGTDPDDVTGMVLDGLREVAAQVEVIAVLGAGAPHAQALSARVPQLLYPATFRQDVRDMPALLRWADVAVGAAGGSSLERCCLGLPSILVRTADNQRHIDQALDAAGAAIALGEWQNGAVRSVGPTLRRLVESPGSLNAMAQKARSLIDGLGAARVAVAVLGWERTRAGHCVTLRRAATGSAAAGGSATLRHVLLRDGSPAGTLDLEPVSAGSDSAFRLLIQVDPPFRRSGVAAAAARLARGLFPDATLEIGDAPAFTATWLEAAGFRAVQPGLFRQRPLRADAT